MLGFRRPILPVKQTSNPGSPAMTSAHAHAHHTQLAHGQFGRHRSQDVRCSLTVPTLAPQDSGFARSRD
eukprot:scaffold7513_cov31-Tisochrysis_lutea.AAC.1